MVREKKQPLPIKRHRLTLYKKGRPCKKTENFHISIGLTKKATLSESVSTYKPIYFSEDRDVVIVYSVKIYLKT